MTTIASLPDGPYDIEFFFDTGCPFAWMTSRWIHQVIDAKGIKVGWRFISLKFINENNEQVTEAYKQATEAGLRFHRICASARERFGNEAVGNLYSGYGNAYWYRTLDGDFGEKMASAAAGVDVAAIIAGAGLPADLVDAADDDAWDTLIRAESDEAFERTGDDVGTPIITWGEGGNSMFGPVISSLPDEETALKYYDALRVVVDFEGFSELKRTKRPQLDLPLLQ